MASRLDQEYPQGNPHSASCRWCGKRRYWRGKAIVCDECDPNMLIPPKKEAA